VHDEKQVACHEKRIEIEGRSLLKSWHANCTSAAGAFRAEVEGWRFAMKDSKVHGERGSSPIRVMVLGLRGVPDVQGGIETHCRKLYPPLARLGCRVEVIQRSRYFQGRRRRRWHRVKLTYLWAPRGSGLETAVHSLLGVLYAAVVRPDILHLHAVGPGVLAPIARACGLRVVVTHHAADYRREKWGPLARFLLRAGERFGMRGANRPIVVS
jgi:glycosyltransferase involved in cell wall biosynthesis